MKRNGSSHIGLQSFTSGRPSTAQRRFTSAKFLEQIRRATLQRFCARFVPDWPGADGLDDTGYYFHLHLALACGSSAPVAMIEALHEIHALSSRAGHERLEAVMAQNGTNLALPPNATRAEAAMCAWMDAPDLFAQAHARERMARLVTFEYFQGTASAVPSHVPWSNGLMPDSFVPAIQSEMDAWFARRCRGEETVRVQVQEIDDEWWFLIRHGDTFTRATTVERRRTRVLQYRPARDDLVVYAPERDELRVHAGTRAEKEMYRQLFGLHLWGDPRHFAGNQACTLDPLLTDGRDALAADDVAGVESVVLREVEIETRSHQNEVTVRKAGSLDVVPEEGRLTRAVFDISFANAARPRKLEICPPNMVRMSRHSDAAIVQLWMEKRGFRR